MWIYCIILPTYQITRKDYLKCESCPGENLFIPLLSPFSPGSSWMEVENIIRVEMKNKIQYVFNVDGVDYKKHSKFVSSTSFDKERCCGSNKTHFFIFFSFSIFCFFPFDFVCQFCSWKAIEASGIDSRNFIMHKYVFRIQIDKRDEHAVNFTSMCSRENISTALFFDVNFNVHE